MATDKPDSPPSDAAEREPAAGGTAASASEGAPHPSFADYAVESVPAAAVGAAGKDGRLELCFATDADGETNLVRDLARTPFHVSGTLGHDPHPDAETVYVQSPTGGVAQGDRHAVEIAARDGAVAHVSTQSATKVLSMERNYAAADYALSVGASAHLDYVPEPTILNADARYYQELAVELSPSGSAVVGDVVVPGRLARGERFEFERYLSRLRVRSDDELLVDDATHLAPGETDPTASGALGEFAVLGTLYVLAPSADAATLSDRLHERASEAAASDGVAGNGGDAGGAARAGATVLPNGTGVAVRALGHRAEQVTESLDAAWDAARTDLVGVGAPDARRL